MLPLPARLKITAKLLRTIDAQREATGDQGIGSAVGTCHSGLRTRRSGARMDDESGVAQSPKPVTNTLTSRQKVDLS